MSWNIRTFRRMFTDDSLYRIKSNDTPPATGRVLISEPFLNDWHFGRSVILMVSHSRKGSMGLILNKPLPVALNDIMDNLDYPEDIPVYCGGPMCTDTLFYLHTFKGLEDAYPIADGLYLNGDFDCIRRYLKNGRPVQGHLRFFLGYTGWEAGQLAEEISQDTWMVGQETNDTIMDEATTPTLWKDALSHLGEKYRIWSRFPLIPTMN